MICIMKLVYMRIIVVCQVLNKLPHHLALKIFAKNDSIWLLICDMCYFIHKILCELLMILGHNIKK